ncbi:metal ABC transporter solute-binding protein, Zn/Mn family [Fastidiosibacter lacustris]|uniref:metal ABC transporter solute-binding protein, Zn/Mn family n=1 Tax=Fastidiosibacter lacustris TaxID=2056695 RepID=UPI0013004F45|nr:zinc ABC transporter substrate-binding protein [Fastidiosibacter lacustris]
MLKKLTCLTFIFITTILLYNQATAEIKVVAAENFYENVASLIGGDYVTTTSIINNPDADPHLFTTSTQTAIAINNAQVVIYNGADYDPWIKQLLNAQSNNNITIIDVAALMNAKSGDNPHLWYNPNTFPTLAKKLTTVFSQLEPEYEKTFKLNMKTFDERYQMVYAKINEIKGHFAGTAVTATEPVFGYMAEALGLKMLGEKFQWAIMNDAEPTPKMLIDYQNLFNQKKVKVLFYNQQVQDNVIDNILNLATENQIPTVGISETMPQNDNVITWLNANLEETQKALEKAFNKQN